jgi:hypothetical protein
LLLLRSFSFLPAFTLLIVTFCAADLPAQEGASQTGGLSPASRQAESAAEAPRWSNRGRWNYGFQLGYAVQNAIPRNISHINLVIAQPQLRLIVADWKKGPIRRFELINEGLIGNAVHPGGRVTGYSLFFHFDTPPLNRRWRPFVNLGSSVLNTTLHRKVIELDGSLQFFSQAGAGVQYFFRPQSAVVFEYRYAHMSNASIEPPNRGFNASMLTIGFRWLRRP